MLEKTPSPIKSPKSLNESFRFSKQLYQKVYKLHRRKSQLWTTDALKELKEKGSELIGGGNLGLVRIQKELGGSWLLSRFKPEQVLTRLVHERNTEKGEQGKKRKKDKDE